MENKEQIEMQQKIDDLRIAIAHFVEEHKKLMQQNEVLKKALQNACYSIADKNLVKDKLEEQVLLIYNGLIESAKMEGNK